MDSMTYKTAEEKSDDQVITDSQKAASNYNYDTVSGSTYSGQGDVTFSQTPSLASVVKQPDPLQPEPQPSQIIIVGTAHVSEKSVNEVKDTIEREKPDIVAVELCKSRYDSLKGEVKDSEIPIKDILRGGKIYYFLVHLLLAYVQKKIGDGYQ